ncbi:ankyrin repeat-containing domain protein, partial [Baffinella frigidus]
SGMTSCSPLVEAVHCRNIPVVKLLLRLDADVTARNVDGNTAIHDAVEYGGDAIVRLLLCNGADKRLLDNDAQTPIDL